MTGMISFEKEARALSLYEQRAFMISKNIANSNTPGFKAQDMNFQEAMLQTKKGINLKNTNDVHIPISSSHSVPVYYRVPMQNRVDGNTVDDEIERKNFLENSLKYQAGLGFMESKAAQLIKAIKGE